MFNFKNNYEPRKKWDPNDLSTYANKGLPGLSKYWRYTTLDAQNNNNLNNINFSSNSNINNNNSNNYSNQGSYTSPDDITLEISYDNFYALGVDMMKKKKYAEELKKQIEENKIRKKLEKEKKKLDDLKDEIRIEKERKKIEDSQREEKKRNLPKINITPYYPQQKNNEPIKIYTPPPSIPLINKYRTPPKPNLNFDLTKNYSHEIPRTKYVYRKVYNTEETKNFLREREEGLEKFDKEMKNQLKMLKNDFNFGMKQLNDEVDYLSHGIKDKNHHFRYLVGQKINELSYDIKNNNNKKINIQVEHIYNVIKKTKDGKSTIQQFTSYPDFVKYPFDGNKYIIKTSKPFNGGDLQIINENNLYDDFSDIIKLPHINLSHCISYS